MSDWTWNDHYTVAWAPTDTPGLFVVIEQDVDVSPPDGDTYPPALIGHGWSRRDYEFYKHSYTDLNVLEWWLRAVIHYDEPVSEVDGLAARYMRVFHDTSVYALLSSVDRYANVVLFDTPAWRERVGLTQRSDRDMDRKPSILGYADWQAYLDGEVYGIGWAVQHDPDASPLEGLVKHTCWGLYGQEYAQQKALDFSGGRPTEEELDSLTAERALVALHALVNRADVLAGGADDVQEMGNLTRPWWLGYFAAMDEVGKILGRVR